MRKILYTAALALSLGACTKDDNSDINKQEINKTEETRLQVAAEVDDSGNLVGVVNKELLEKDAKFKTDFRNNFDAYTPNIDVIEDLKTALNGVKIVGFLGTWCPDSRREVPRFYKIMDGIKFTNFDMIAVNRSKKANGLENGYNLNYVATFVLSKDGKEIGRFVENVSVNKGNGGSLENDLHIIARGDNYTPSR